MTKTTTKITFAMIAITSLMFAGPSVMTPAHALAPGDQLAQYNLEAIVDSSNHCGIGLAFDGTDLYLSRCADPTIYTIDPTNGLASANPNIVDAAIPELPNAMAYDSKRNGLWIGTQTCNQNGAPIYFYDFDLGGPAVHQFDIPFGLINPATGNSFVQLCFVDGLAFNQNDPITGGDALYFSDDVRGELGVFDTAGNLIHGEDPSLIDPSLATFSPGTSGLAIGGSNLYLGNNGGGDVFRADVPTFASLGQFVDAVQRTEDMECDSTTFAPLDVMWVRSTPQSNPADNLITAFLIEEGSCSQGGGLAIEKFYTHTNNNWDLVCETPESILDNGQCVLPDGTIVESPRPANINTEDVFADPLDQNGDDKFVLLGKENKKKTVINPGQYIAVSNVFVPAEQDIWVEEDFDQCNDDIGDVNPRSVPGGVQVVLVLENGDVIDIDDDLAAGIGGSIELQDNKALVHVEDVPANSVLRVMVKFAPYDDLGMIGLECTNYERLLDDQMQPIFEASADLIIEEK